MSEDLDDGYKVPRASARWYPITVLLTFLLFLSVIPCAMLSLADLGPSLHSSESARYVYFWDKQKQKIAEQTQGRRLVLIGGSGALYSVRAKMLQQQLGIPVINNALHAGLGIDYLLYRARKSLHPGDTAILFLEYAHYLRPAPSWTLADYVLPHDLAYFASQPLKTQIGLLGKLTPTEYGNRVYDALLGKPIDGKKKLASLNNRGDLIENRRESQKDFQKAGLDRYRPGGSLVLQQESAATISDFYRWCQKNGITVIAGYPAFMDFPVYHSGAHLAFFQSLGSYYHSLGVPTLGEPSDFMFPKSMFFDSEYHMHDVGAAVMTELAAQRLASILGVTRKPGGNTPDTRIDQPLRLMFSEKDAPVEVESLKGFSVVEPWGRWTDAEKASIKLSSPLPLRFRLDAHVAHVFNDKTRTPIRVRVGKEERSIPVSGPEMNISLEFQTDGKTDTIEIIPPEPQSPKQLGLSGDSRILGLGFSRLEITPLAAGAAAKISAKPR